MRILYSRCINVQHKCSKTYIICWDLVFYISHTLQHRGCSLEREKKAIRSRTYIRRGRVNSFKNESPELLAYSRLVSTHEFHRTFATCATSTRTMSLKLWEKEQTAKRKGASRDEERLRCGSSSRNDNPDIVCYKTMADRERIKSYYII